MSRRQTLGALSPSQLNARAGGGAPARVATTAKENGLAGGPTGAARSRKSMAPQAADKGALLSAAPLGGASSQGQNSQAGGPMLPDPRRSSAYAPKPAGPKTDPRPLSDKNFLNNCIRTVITYLSTHGYPAAVAPKTLASPTAKDFTLIIQFLFQQFDSNMKTFGKIEDEVPQFFKRLNYPFQISKSALFAVGSPHSWPAVLAAITWLVELLNYNEKTDEAAGSSSMTGSLGGPGMMEDQEAATKRQFFEYICTSYKYFLAGDDMRCNAVDEEMLGQFRQKERAIADAHARVKESNDALVAELGRLGGEKPPIVAAQERLAERQTDGAKFEQLIENLQALKVAQQRKLAERQADLQSKQEALAAVAKENEALRARIAAQPVNKADLNRMVMERTRQREVLDALTSQGEELEAKVHEQEVQLVAALKSLEGAVQRYNQLAHRLKLVPASAKRADGVTYELRINRDASTPGELANVDLKGVVKPGLERLCELYRTKAAQLGRDLLALREAAAAAAESVAEKREENAAIEAQIAKYEAQLKAAREAQEDKVRAVAGRAERLRDEVDGLRSAASVRCAEVEARKAAAAAELEQMQRNCEAELNRLRVDLRTALESLLQHRMHVAARLQQTAAGVRNVAAQLQAVPLPEGLSGAEGGAGASQSGPVPMQM